MSVREHPDKPGYFIIDCRPDGYQGKRERLVVQCSKTEALDLERVIMRRHVDTPVNTPKSIGAIYHAWIVWYRANKAPTTTKDVISVWKNRLSGPFTALRPKNLTRGLIEQYKIDRLKTGVTHRTITKELNYFSGMLKWAVDHDYCDPLPFQVSGFSRKQTAPPKPRPLTPQQVTQLYNEIEEKFRLIFLLMADCGLRLTEAVTLQRSNLEFDHGVIFVIGKGGKERIVPITTDRLRAELDKVRDCTGYLSVNPQTKTHYVTIRSALIRAAKPGCNPHTTLPPPPSPLIRDQRHSGTYRSYSLTADDGAQLYPDHRHVSAPRRGISPHRRGKIKRHDQKRVSTWTAWTKRGNPH